MFILPEAVALSSGVIPGYCSSILQVDGLDGLFVILTVEVFQLISIENKPPTLPVLKCDRYNSMLNGRCLFRHG